MSSAVQDALARAAERSKRRAELEVAWLVVERGLGRELAEDEFGWCSVLSMPYAWIDRSHKPQICMHACNLHMHVHAG